MQRKRVHKHAFRVRKGHAVLTQIPRRLGRIELKLHGSTVCTLCIRVKDTFLRLTSCLSRARVSERRLETFVRLLRNEPSSERRSRSAERRAERNERVLIATLECADSVHVSLLQPTELCRPTER